MQRAYDAGVADGREEGDSAVLLEELKAREEALRARLGSLVGATADASVRCPRRRPAVPGRSCGAGAVGGHQGGRVRSEGGRVPAAVRQSGVLGDGVCGSGRGCEGVLRREQEQAAALRRGGRGVCRVRRRGTTRPSAQPLAAPPPVPLTQLLAGSPGGVRVGRKIVGMFVVGWVMVAAAAMGGARTGGRRGTRRSRRSSSSRSA